MKTAQHPGKSQLVLGTVIISIVHRPWGVLNGLHLKKCVQVGLGGSRSQELIVVSSGVGKAEGAWSTL